VCFVRCDFEAAECGDGAERLLHALSEYLLPN
jgi:hypothetical protein